MASLLKGREGFIDTADGDFVCVDMKIGHSALHKLKTDQYSQFVETGFNHELLPWLGLRRTT